MHSIQWSLALDFLEQLFFYRYIKKNLGTYLWQSINPEERKNTTPRTIMIGGKAFATYTNAKRIVKLVNDVGAVVNNDPDVKCYLKVNN